ncbi:MAG: hypothetical protein H6Q89_5517 [Myxococcaceae bacterium]|nr:hypothetical protein [Myxococcaceae bacterium]
MPRPIDSSASAVPLAPILLLMSVDAYRDVTEGIRELSAGLRLATRRRRWLTLCLRVAVEQLHRTYLTLVWEATRVCTLTPAGLEEAIETLRRRSLVPRVHQRRGDFARIERAFQLLQAQKSDRAAVAPRGWANREVHLFGLLVPLAGYTEELARELQGLLASPSDPQVIEARLGQARRQIEPVLRYFCLTTQALKHFLNELNPPRR